MEVMGERNENLDLERYHNHQKLLRDLLEKYFQPMLANQEKKSPRIKLSILQPPIIPSQDHAYDCGVFLLLFIKHLVQKRKFDFDTRRCIEFRESIKEELLTKKIMKETRPRTRKRTQSMDSSEIPLKRNNHFGTVQGLYRTFKNPDNETCWMNSCLQLVLTAVRKQPKAPKGKKSQILIFN
jgi:hypothetical protein